jgi:hypothetical protein
MGKHVVIVFGMDRICIRLSAESIVGILVSALALTAA